MLVHIPFPCLGSLIKDNKNRKEGREGREGKRKRGGKKEVTLLPDLEKL